MESERIKIWIEEDAPNLKRRTSDRIMGIVIIVMGVILIVMFAFLLLPIMDPMIFMLMGIGVVLIFMGYFQYQQATNQRAIYVAEDGIGLPTRIKSVSSGKKVDFISFSQIDKIELVELGWGWGLKSIRLTIPGEKDYDINYQSITHPLGFLRAVEFRIPGKLGEEARKLLDNQLEPRADVLERMQRTAKTGFDVYLMIGMLIFTTLMVSAMSPDNPFVLLFIIPFIVIMSAFFTSMAIMSERRRENNLMRHFTKAETGGIALTHTFLARIFKKVQYEVSWDKVQAVKRRCDSVFYANFAEVLLSDGTKIEAPYQVLEAAEKMGMFEKVQDGLINPNPKPMEAPISKVQLWRVGLLSFLGVFSILLLGGGVSGVIFSGFEATRMIVLPILILAAVIVLIVIFFSTARHARVEMKDVIIEEDCIRILDKGTYAHKTIPRKEILGIVRKPDVVGESIEVQTKSGIEILPVQFYKQLKTNFPEAFAEAKEGGKGHFLWEEHSEEFEKRKRQYVFSGIIWLVMFGIFSVIMYSIFGSILSFFFIILCAIGPAFIIWGRSQLPIKIYENGVEVSSSLFGWSLFTSWGEFTSFHDLDKYYVLMGPGVRQVRLQKDQIGLSTIMEDVRDRIGKVEHKIIVDLTKKTEDAKKWENLVYPAGAVIVSVIAVLVLLIFSGGEFTSEVFILAFGILFPIGMILFVSQMLYTLAKRRKKYSLRVKMDLRKFAAFLLVMNVIYLIVVGAGFWTPSISAPSFSSSFGMSGIPGNIWSGAATISNETHYLTQSIYVPPGGSMEIENSSIYFQGPGYCGIYVDEGGYLFIGNSTVAARSPGDCLWFEVYGDMYMYNSLISDIWGTPEKENFEGGIELYQANVTIEKCTIKNGNTNGILAYRANLRMVETTVEFCQDDAVELHETDAILENCVVRHNGWPIMFWDKSDGYVSNSTIAHNEHGMWIYHSSPTIENCFFLDTREGAAIQVDGIDSEPEFRNNRFEDNQSDISGYGLMGSVQICMFIILPLMSLVGFLFIYNMNRKLIT